MKLFAPSRRIRGFTLVELLVVIGIIALLISILLPALNHVREEAQKAKCSANLTQIFAALTTYANNNNGNYPRTYFAKMANSNTPMGSIDCSSGAQCGGPKNGTAKDTPTPTTPNSFGPDVLPNSVTASFFLLLKTTQYPPDIMVCPSSNAQKGFQANSILDWSNFEDTPNWGLTMSYSINCMFPSSNAITTNWQWNAQALSTGFPLVADLNPGGIGGYNPSNNVTNVTHVSSTRDMQQGNSNNHHNKGQQVLYGDKSVQWQPTPFCGPSLTTTAGTQFNDNIYSARTSPNDETGQLSPTQYPYDNLDSYLLPTDDSPNADGAKAFGF
jgi:prepilin-type N-terminal cleavage/methylation domain-containing protein